MHAVAGMLLAVGVNLVHCTIDGLKHEQLQFVWGTHQRMDSYTS